MSEAIRSNALEADTNETLPVGWRQASLAEVAEIRISNVDKKSAVGEIPVRLCNYIDVYKNVYITAALDFMEATATPSEIARFCVDLGDVMITKDSETPDDIGVPAVAIWSDPKLVCGYHLALFKPHRDQIDPVFLAKQLRLPRIAAYYGRLACGSTRYGLSNSGIARTPLRFPPLPQQRKIARILTTVDIRSDESSRNILLMDNRTNIPTYWCEPQFFRQRLDYCGRKASAKRHVTIGRVSRKFRKHSVEQ